MENEVFENKVLDLNQEELDLLAESNFADIFDTIKDDLIKQFSELREPQTRYDVQEETKKFMSTFTKKNYAPFLPLKKYAYENGKSYAKILKGGAILLRDFYLKLNSDITL